MNRFKKELAKRGYKMEKDYPSMPYQTSMDFIEAITVNSELALYTIHYLQISIYLAFDRQMNTTELYD